MGERGEGSSRPPCVTVTQSPGGRCGQNRDAQWSAPTPNTSARSQNHGLWVPGATGQMLTGMILHEVVTQEPCAWACVCMRVHVSACEHVRVRPNFLRKAFTNSGEGRGLYTSDDGLSVNYFGHEGETVVNFRKMGTSYTAGTDFVRGSRVRTFTAPKLRGHRPQGDPDSPRACLQGPGWRGEWGAGCACEKSSPQLCAGSRGPLISRRSIEMAGRRVTGTGGTSRDPAREVAWAPRGAEKGGCGASSVQTTRGTRVVSERCTCNLVENNV